MSKLSAMFAAREPERKAPADHADGVDLATALRLVREQWKVVALCLAVFVGGALAYSMLSPKVWRASARVLLDPREKQLVGVEVARQSQGVEAGWIETRQELVKAYGTLAAVVAKEKLVEDEEILTAAERAGPDPAVAAVRALAERVLVERPKENSLIDITLSSKSPEKAARLANAVAHSFVDQLTAAKVDQARQANDLLARQIDEMRAKMLEAEARVEEYKRSNGIAMTRGNLVEEDTLRQSNETLVAARTKTQEARERSERLNQLLQTGDSAVLSQADAIGSAVITRLKIEAATAMRRKIELEQTLGPRHPRVAAAAADVERARAQVVEEAKSLAATAALDHQVARANEENARKAVERAQARLADASQATVGLQELENEASARRDLYKSFVTRMEETTLQSNTQLSDARVVSPAQIPLYPFSPRSTLAMALALVAGLGFGLAAALHLGHARWKATHAAPVPAPAVDGEADVVAAAPAVEVAAPAMPAETASLALVDEPMPAASLEPTAEPAPAPEATEVAPAPVAAPVLSAVAAAARAVVPPAAAFRGGRRPGDLREVAFALSLAEIVRLGSSNLPGRGAAALVETDDGEPDATGVACLRELARSLGAAGPGTMVVFADRVPSLVTASLALGFARAVGDAALVDLAHDGEPLDAFFEAGAPLADADLPGEADWERVREAGVVLARPLDPVIAGDPESLPANLAAFVDALGAETASCVVHLGRAPSAALLFDVAERADHVVMVADEADLADETIAAEIETLKGLLPHFDGLVLLAREEIEARPRPARRRRAGA